MSPPKPSTPRPGHRDGVLAAVPAGNVRPRPRVLVRSLHRSHQLVARVLAAFVERARVSSPIAAGALFHYAMLWMTTFGQLTAIAGLVISLTDCGATGTVIIRRYPGPPRPSETIGIIRTSRKDPVLDAVDGEPPDTDEDGYRLHVEVMPGVHEVTVKVCEGCFCEPITARFVAESGKTYRMAVARAPADYPFRYYAYAYEVDRFSDAPGHAATWGPRSPDLEHPSGDVLKSERGSTARPR
jgi:hypothetical protein